MSHPPPLSQMNLRLRKNKSVHSKLTFSCHVPTCETVLPCLLDRASEEHACSFLPHVDYKGLTWEHWLCKATLGKGNAWDRNSVNCDMGLMKELVSNHYGMFNHVLEFKFLEFKVQNQN